MPALNADCFSVYLRELSKAYPDTLNVIALDNAPAHIARAVVVPENVVLLPLPSYSAADGGGPGTESGGASVATRAPADRRLRRGGADEAGQLA